jgi:hypothetical protein
MDSTPYMYVRHHSPSLSCLLFIQNCIRQQVVAQVQLEIRYNNTFTYCSYQANYINALAVSVLPFFEPAKPITLGGLFVTLGGFVYDIG